MPASPVQLAVSVLARWGVRAEKVGSWGEAGQDFSPTVTPGGVEGDVGDKWVQRCPRKHQVYDAYRRPLTNVEG